MLEFLAVLGCALLVTAWFFTMLCLGTGLSLKDVCEQLAKPWRKW